MLTARLETGLGKAPAKMASVVDLAEQFLVAK
jgi:hypothetical protein